MTTLILSITSCSEKQAAILCWSISLPLIKPLLSTASKPGITNRLFDQAIEEAKHRN